MSFTKLEKKCFFLSKIKSANWELKSIAKKFFKNPEHFSINAIEGVVLECLTEKNSAKNVEYLMNIF